MATVRIYRRLADGKIEEAAEPLTLAELGDVLPEVGDHLLFGEDRTESREVVQRVFDLDGLYIALVVQA